MDRSSTWWWLTAAVAAAMMFFGPGCATDREQPVNADVEEPGVGGAGAEGAEGYVNPHGNVTDLRDTPTVPEGDQQMLTSPRAVDDNSPGPFPPQDPPEEDSELPPEAEVGDEGTLMEERGGELLRSPEEIQNEERGVTTPKEDQIGSGEELFEADEGSDLYPEDDSSVIHNEPIQEN